jgi:hypothetical protein
MLTETLLIIPFSVIGRCSLVRSSHWLQENVQEFNISQAVFGIILQNPRRLPVSIFSVKIATLESLKRVNGSVFNLSKQV